MVPSQLRPHSATAGKPRRPHPVELRPRPLRRGLDVGDGPPMMAPPLIVTVK
ncbi:hypothetical protein HanRHA438_Chr03g0102661 [Helianthus annuus]|nr:hypothetical protein HanRHA438_Chr03g0102661 [Helianthus annuus]